MLALDAYDKTALFALFADGHAAIVMQAQRNLMTARGLLPLLALLSAATGTVGG